ncbi:MAG: hypothetical protein IEMM0006_0336 [bacterium]|nr:MAG: hypothetical protein IEMM0006_0336 [bacterium]
MRCWFVKNMRIFVLAFVPLVAVPFHVAAQQLNSTSRNSFKDNWAIQLNPGFSQFYGDATNHNYFQKFKGEIDLRADLGVRKMILPALGVGLDFTYAGLKSYKDQKADGTRVDYRLKGSYYDANLFVYLDFNHLFAGYKPGRKITVYGTVGMGWSFWNSALTDGITGLTIKSGSKNGSYTYKTNALVVPVGVGLNYHISDRWDVNIGGNLRTVFNDDVDVWHDGFKYDQIFSTKVGVTYHIRPGWGVAKKPKPAKNKSYRNEKEQKSKPFIPVYGFDQIRVMATPAKQPQTIEPLSVPKKETRPVAPREFEFRVQIMANNIRLKNVSSLQVRYHLPYPVVETHQDGLYRYSVGSFKSYSAALAASKEIRSHGVFDAFVVAYRNGLRIPITSGMKR